MSRVSGHIVLADVRVRKGRSYPGLIGTTNLRAALASMGTARKCVGDALVGLLTGTTGLVLVLTSFTLSCEVFD